MNAQEARRNPITPGLFSFLRGLARNNNRPWFEANKPRYLAEVRDAATRFVSEVGPGLSKISRHIVADPRPTGGSVSRIYRDIRFSKDKSPYKTNVGIHFSHDLVESMGEHLPGFYLHLAPGECGVSSGIWQPEPRALGRIREAIVRDARGWSVVRKMKAEFWGESLKRVPPVFDAGHRFADDLRRKDFIASIALADSKVTGASFPNDFLSKCKQLDPLNRFLATATHTPW